MGEKLPVTQAEWNATPRPAMLPPDAVDLRLASTTYLKPCPFCGKNNPNPVGTLNEQTGIFGYSIECSNYRCMGSVFSSGDDRGKARSGAVDNWQRRSPT